MVKYYCDCCGEEIIQGHVTGRHLPNGARPLYGFRLDLKPADLYAWNQDVKGEFRDISCELCQDCAEKVADLLNEQLRQVRL